jgi:RsiW-degrading membrane proteinase PrsW (M82 family)
VTYPTLGGDVTRFTQVHGEPVPTALEDADPRPEGAPAPVRPTDYGGRPAYGLEAPTDSAGSPMFSGEPGGPTRSAESRLLERCRQKLDGYAGLNKLEGFSLKEMFSEVLKRRAPDDVEDYFTIGSRGSTPPILDVCTMWPKPWFFARVLVFISLIYISQLFVVMQFGNVLVLPGMMMTGSLAMPLATAFLFFELNTPRNVSFHRVLMLVCKGGMLSILISVAGFDLSKLDLLFGAPAAGVVEEAGKLLAVVLVTRKAGRTFILNGCLFGAAIGAGFAAFESAGYAFAALWKWRDVNVMVMSISIRGMLAPFGHVTWTAITAGALWRARARHGSTWRALSDRSFLQTLGLAMALHATWNVAAGIGGTVAVAGVVIVAAATWHVALGVVQQGLKQVEEVQASVRQGQASSTSADSGHAGCVATWG